MKVKFIAHSGFYVELEHHAFLFDYYQGELPEVPQDKALYVLASHSHYDHFHKSVFGLSEAHEKTAYILSADISVKKAEAVTFVKPGEKIEIDDIQVETLRSTDQGVAFLVSCEGKTIYHAGDLNWWHWEGETGSWNEDVAAAYKAEIDKMAGRAIDLAFVVLDPRQEAQYAWGMNYFIEKAGARVIFPMHCWNKLKVISRWKREYGPEHGQTQVMDIAADGQSWDL